MTAPRKELQVEIRCAKAAGLESVVAVLETMAEIDSTVARIEAADRDRETVQAASKAISEGHFA